MAAGRGATARPGEATRAGAIGAGQQERGSLAMAGQGDTAAQLELPEVLADGCAVLASVLSHGLDVLLLPRQVLLAAPAGQQPGALSFVHGVPRGSTAAGVTHAQDRRLRRILLNLAGIPTPPGMTFSAGGSQSLVPFADRYGYPLTLREAIGGSTASAAENIADAEELRRAVARIRRRTADHLAPARSLVSAAYAESILGWDVDEAGNHVASPLVRLLIEKRPPGRYVRCLACGGALLAAVEIEASGMGRSRDVTAALHPEVAALALRAAAVIPGLPVAAVDLIVDDPTRALSGQGHCVMELLERPHLRSFADAGPDLGERLAAAILRSEARRCSMTLDVPSDEVSVIARIEGLPRPELVLPALHDACARLQLAAAVRQADPAGGTLEACLGGAPAAVALLLEALMSGVHFGERATVAEVRHAAPRPRAASGTA